jgi:hypothetical protein
VTHSRQHWGNGNGGKAYRCRACHAELVSASVVYCSSILSLLFKKNYRGVLQKSIMFVNAANSAAGQRRK